MGYRERRKKEKREAFAPKHKKAIKKNYTQQREMGREYRRKQTK